MEKGTSITVQNRRSELSDWVYAQELMPFIRICMPFPLAQWRSRKTQKIAATIRTSRMFYPDRISRAEISTMAK